MTSWGDGRIMAGGVCGSGMRDLDDSLELHAAHITSDLVALFKREARCCSGRDDRLNIISRVPFRDVWKIEELGMRQQANQSLYMGIF